MCLKIVAECREYVLLETVAIQDMQDRVFLFIRYLYRDETQPETRKRPTRHLAACTQAVFKLRSTSYIAIELKCSAFEVVQNSIESTDVLKLFCLRLHESINSLIITRSRTFSM